MVVNSLPNEKPIKDLMYLVEGAGIDATQHWVIKKLLELYPKPPEPEPEEPQARKLPGQVWV